MNSRLRWYAFIAVAVAGAPVAMLAIAAGLAFVLRRQALWHLWLSAPHWSSLGYGLLGGVTSMTLVLALHTLSPRFAAALAESSVRTATEAVDRFGWALMLVIGTTAALGEESLLRAGLQPTIGIALAALLFGLAHGGWRREMWAYAVAATLAGLVFGHLYGATGDLWASIFAHAIHNASAIAFVALGIYPDAAEQPVEVTPVSRPTIRELGLQVGTLPPGPCNAITDVPGVSVGHCTVWAGEGALVPGSGPWRTGVTALLPHCGNLYEEKVPAGLFVLNGYGKATGLWQVAELGVLETPVLLTGTLNVFRVADALTSWMLERNPEIASVNPVVLECNDSYLSDVQGRPVAEEHVRTALAAAAGGPVRQGAVGAGTGMRAFGFKAGIGTASRRVGEYTLGVLVLANFGRREQLLVLGMPIGPHQHQPVTAPLEPPGPPAEPDLPQGSCIVVLATDAPLDARQLQRLARRAVLGLARTGGTAQNGSGEFSLAFSTAYRISGQDAPPAVVLLADASPAQDALFAAAVEATEEAVLNTLFCASTVVGRDGHTAEALSVDTFLARLRSAGQP